MARSKPVVVGGQSQRPQELVLSPERPAKPLPEKKWSRERLYKLDRSSTQFLERLNKLLQDGEWIEGLKSLPENELMEPIDYLDNVRFISMLIKPCSPIS